MKNRYLTLILGCFCTLSLGFSLVPASGEVVLDIPWGTGEETLGLLTGPELERCGPLSFSLSGDSILILDTVNRRIAKVQEGEKPKTFAKDVAGWSLCSDGGSGYVVIQENRLIHYDAKGHLRTQFKLPDENKIIEGYGSELSLSPDQRITLFGVNQKSLSVAAEESADGSKLMSIENTKTYAGLKGKTQENLCFSIKRISSQDIRILGQDPEGKIQVSIPIQMKGDLAGAVLFKGQDNQGRVYVEIERLSGNRALLEVHRYSLAGECLAVYSLPNQYYTTIYKKTEITPEGSVYQMLTTPAGVQVIRY